MSGGLDSLLATKLIIEQGIEVEALHFTSPFCNCTKGDKGCGIQAVRTAKELGVNVTVKLKGLDYLEIVKSPKHGYGKNMNPCVDCRIFMLKAARGFMEEIGASFVVTGEVLGQRPMSQRRDAIALIERESGLAGVILRPLSAQHLPPTRPEIEGIVDRARLLSIVGRSRKTQYELVNEYSLNEFSCPGGGCLLTDPLFAAKVRDLFTFKSDVTMKDMVLLKTGRHFRLSPDTKLIIGRNEEENEKLESLWASPDVLLTPVGFKGPSGILSGPVDDHNISVAANILSHYGKNQTRPITVESNNRSGDVRQHVVEPVQANWEGLKI